MKAKEVFIELSGNKGNESGRMYTCDYSYDYIKINADYHT
jgi:glutamate N-acetyltransferase/amino-acid N-acetyltransferase